MTPRALLLFPILTKSSGSMFAMLFTINTKENEIVEIIKYPIPINKLGTLKILSLFSNTSPLLVPMISGKAHLFVVEMKRKTEEFVLFDTSCDLVLVLRT
jgi:hypothetical protein